MKFKCLIAGLLILAGSLNASLQDHFKSVTDVRPTNQGLEEVDFIYMINLDQRPEKFKMSLDQLTPYGITPYRFSAVNGWEMTFDTVDDVGVKLTPGMNNGQWGTCYLRDENWEPHHEIVQKIGRVYFCHCMSRGAIGICLSHLSILQDAYDQGYETIWVMEDDIQVIRDPHLITDAIKKMDKYVGRDNWDLLFTDQDTKNQEGKYVPCMGYAWRPNFTPANPGRFVSRRMIGLELRQIGARYGAYSMIVRRSGMKKILDFFKTYQIFLPYDMDFYMPENIKLFCVMKDIVSTMPKAASDNGGANYKNN